MRAAAITNLFPSNVDPSYAPFNRQQFAELARLCELEVYGVVPWRFGRWYAAGDVRDVVPKETIDGVPVRHPRYPAIPGLPAFNAALYASALLPELALAHRARPFDVLLAAYAYPDGCAGVLIGRALGLPVVVKCHGSDLNRVPTDLAARLQLEVLLPRAAAVVVVSRKLEERAAELGVPRAKLHVVYNGVDRARFRVLERTEARAKLGIARDRRVVLCVGHLAEHKGTRDLLAAAARLQAVRSDTTVAFVGDGPLAAEVRAAAERSTARGSVLAVGRVPHAEVGVWMAAADVVCLPSWDEGMPNVVREAHAAGRPVVATRVGGVPEAVASPVLGCLVPPRDPAALADALARVLDAPAPDAEAIARAAIVPTWAESAAQLHAVLEASSRRVE